MESALKGGTKRFPFIEDVVYGAQGNKNIVKTPETS